MAAELDRIGLHECRHTFASLMIGAGVNAKALASYLGHSSIQTTFDRYGHLMPWQRGRGCGAPRRLRHGCRQTSPGSRRSRETVPRSVPHAPHGGGKTVWRHGFSRPCERSQTPLRANLVWVRLPPPPSRRGFTACDGSFELWRRHARPCQRSGMFLESFVRPSTQGFLRIATATSLACAARLRIARAWRVGSGGTS